MEFKDKEWLYEFLMGLDPDFSTIRTHVLSMKTTPALGEAYRLASEEEQQKLITLNKRAAVEPAAFKTQGYREGSFDHGRGYKGGSKDFKRNNEDKVDHCSKCRKDGHKRESCFEIIGYPDWWPGKRKNDKVKSKSAYVEVEPGLAGLTDAQYQALMKHFSVNEQKGDDTRKANMAGKIDNFSDWIVDSGSTDYVVNNIESLESLLHMKLQS